MKKVLIIFFCFIIIIKSKAQQTDSTLTYVAGEGLFLKLGKADANSFNLVSAVQSGFQYTRLDSSSIKRNSNRLSLNLVRVALNASLLKDKVSLGIVTDFTGVTPILEGWVGFSVLNKHGKIILGQKQAHTNNRLAMADERYSQVMGQTLAGKSNDGTVYGGLMQNFVSSTREGGLFFESGFKVKTWKFYPSVSITTGEGQNFFDAQTNTGYKYGGRLDVLPLGDFIKNSAFIAHDIYREPRLKIAAGFAASYNVKASSPVGSENMSITGIYDKTGQTDYANYKKIVADFILKVNGFSLVGEYLDGSIYGKELYTNAGGTSRLSAALAANYYNVGSAYNVQSSYITKTGWAVDGRFTLVKPEFKTTASLIQEENWYTAGINKYMKSNAVRAGLNFNYIDRKAVSAPTKKWIANLALQIIL